jgi:hypothetical protein
MRYSRTSHMSDSRKFVYRIVHKPPRCPAETPHIGGPVGVGTMPLVAPLDRYAEYCIVPAVFVVSKINTTLPTHRTGAIPRTFSATTAAAPRRSFGGWKLRTECGHLFVA